MDGQIEQTATFARTSGENASTPAGILIDWTLLDRVIPR